MIFASLQTEVKSHHPFHMFNKFTKNQVPAKSYHHFNVINYPTLVQYCLTICARGVLLGQGMKVGQEKTESAYITCATGNTPCGYSPSCNYTVALHLHAIQTIPA